MGFTKTVSGIVGWQAPLVKKGTAIASLLDRGKYIYPGGDRVGIVLPENVTFYAPLTQNTKDLAGAADVFSRPSDGTYKLGGTWGIAGPGVSRFEDGGVLIEPARTNVVTNYNANPDAALTNVNFATTTGSRVSRPSDLAAEGLLENICTDGNIFQSVWVSGSGFVLVGPLGQIGSTGNVTVSAWLNTGGNDQGFGWTGVGSPANTPSLSRIYISGSTNDPAAVEEIYVFEPYTQEWILSQFELGVTYTNPIITQGASASRATETLTWSPVSDFLNQSQGMVIVEYTSKFDEQSMQTLSVPNNILALSNSVQDIMFFNFSRVTTTDGVNESWVDLLGDLVYDGFYIFAVLWGPSTLQMGVKTGSTWNWGTSVSYTGSFPTDNVLRLGNSTAVGANFKNLTFYDENKGIPWVESNY